MRDAADQQVSILFDDISLPDVEAMAKAAVRQAMLPGGRLLLGLGLHRILRPLAALTQALQALSEGRPEVEVPGLERQDELSAIGRAVQALRIGILAARAQDAGATRARGRRLPAASSRPSTTLPGRPISST